MFPQRQAHVLLHLLQAVVVRVDEVKGQRARQRTAPSSWGDPQKPAGGSEALISERVKVTQRDVGALLARSSCTRALSGYVCTSSLNQLCLFQTHWDWIISSDLSCATAGD